MRENIRFVFGYVKSLENIREINKIKKKIFKFVNNITIEELQRRKLLKNSSQKNCKGQVIINYKEL